jgi:hypothetical protein
MALAKLGAKVEVITIWACEFKIERVNEMKSREAAAWGHSKIRERNLKKKKDDLSSKIQNSKLMYGGGGLQLPSWEQHVHL